MLRVSTLVVCLAVAVPASAQIVRVSVSTAGGQANGASGAPSVSANGRFVVFESVATNLVANDTNGVSDVFLRDRDTDMDGILDEPGAVATTRLSVSPAGLEQNAPSTDPVITPDGRYVCFVSGGEMLAGSDTLGALQIYRLDRTTGSIVRVSVGDAGAAGDLGSTDPVISDDGNVVAFVSLASTLVAGPATTTTGIFVRDIAAGRTTRLTPPGPLSPDAYSTPTVSADGRFVAYKGDRVVRPLNLPVAIRVDLATGESRPLGGTFPFLATLSASGMHALVHALEGFLRLSVDLPPQHATRLPSLGAVVAASSDVSQAVTAASPTMSYFVDFDVLRRDLLPFGVTAGSFSRDSRYLAITSPTPTLVPGNGDTNGVADVLVIDLPDYFDGDDDGLDDRWESTFQVGDPAGDPDGDGLTSLQEFQARSHPNGTTRRYLAEGATGTFFQTAIALANPHPTLFAATVLTFDKGDGTRLRQIVPLPPLESRVVHVQAIPGLGSADVSTTVESDRPIGVDRTMTWDTRAPGDTTRGYGSHMETATASPSTTWFLAEGSTVLDFNLFYLLQNPQATTTHATVRFLRPNGTVVTRTYDLAPASRTTVYVNAVPGLDETDVAGDVQADAPIVVERAMYRDLPGQPFGLGHASMAVPATAPRWFLAEGATGAFFDLFVLIANPGASDALVEVQFAKPDGSVVTRQYTVRASSRHSIYVDALAGLENTPVATTVTSLNGVPIVAERSMYWPGGFFDYYEAHNSAGSIQAARRWVVAGGTVGYENGQTFVLIANTQNQAGSATITVLPPGGNGTGPTQTVTLPPNSRTTVPVAPNLGTLEFGVLVESTGASPVEIVVESANYRTIGGVLWSAGANALATPLP